MTAAPRWSSVWSSVRGEPDPDGPVSVSSVGSGSDAERCMVSQYTDWVPASVDLEKPSAARMYDYLLGGNHNFEEDRELVERLLRIQPEIKRAAIMNRSFLRRAVLFMIENRVRQFLDLGSGIPTVGNVHEIVQAAAPRSRVVYVDNEHVGRDEQTHQNRVAIPGHARTEKRQPAADASRYRQRAAALSKPTRPPDHHSRRVHACCPGHHRGNGADIDTARWAESAPAVTTPPWSRSSRYYRRTCSTGDSGAPATNSAWPSSPGSRRPTTTDAASSASASHPIEFETIHTAGHAA